MNQPTNLSKNHTEIPEFKPTPYMLVWLDVAIQTKSDSPSLIETACKELKIRITRQAWYEWKKKPGFIDWFYSQWREKRKQWIAELDAIGMRQAEAGSYHHWKDMREALGEDNGPSEEATFVWKKK